MQGQVVEYHREYCWVELDDGRCVIARPRARLEVVAKALEQDWEKEGRIIFAQQLTIGDCVSVSEPESGHFKIEEVGERETWLLRRSAGRYRRKPQCLVANADQLAVVIAPGPLMRLSFVDRAFIAAIQGGLTPMLVVNKLDLDPALGDDLGLRAYTELGYRVFFTIATENSGLDTLASALAGKTTVFSGQSGVGKSTILKAITGAEIRISEVAEKTQKGKQTTTTARRYPLHSTGDEVAGYVVDTPGVKEFGLWRLSELDVHEYFSDIATLAQGCTYRDCLHNTEPGCVVKEAIKDGKLAARRLSAYVRLRQEAKESGEYWKA